MSYLSLFSTCDLVLSTQHILVHIGMHDEVHMPTKCASLLRTFGVRQVLSQALWLMPLVPGLRRQRQVDLCEFEVLNKTTIKTKPNKTKNQQKKWKQFNSSYGVNG